MNSSEFSVGVSGLTVLPYERRSRLYGVLKRATDILLGLLILIFTGPLLLIAAGLVTLVTSGSPFIRVPRIGLGGRTILIYKIRTMREGADRLLDEYLKTNSAAAKEWLTRYKLKNDPRIIPYIGNFLRKSSIDELPQLIDVLAGRMSLVGPRPFPSYHLNAFDPSFCEARSSVMPGLTGLWQIECRNEGDLHDQIYWDSKYIEQRSYLLDLSIIIKTPVRVLSGRSAH